MAEQSQAAGARIRAEAAKAVHAVVHGGRSLDAALGDADRRVAPSERSLLRLLSYGTVRFHWRLMAQAGAFLKRPLKARDQVVGALLAVGIYQLTDTRVSDHAAVSLTVEAARLLRRPKLKPLVNGVLRNFLRRPPALDGSASEEVRFDHPQWLIDRLRRDWPDDWQRILAANNEQAPMWLRVNRRRATTERYLERLREATGAPAPGSVLAGVEQAIRLEQPMAVEALPGFAEGCVSVQDAAAQLAAPWLLADGGSRLLDACAAPGGKAAQLLELAGPGATLTAIDADPERVVMIEETLGRLGLQATVLAADASKPERWWDSQRFDRILLDAPCSASGVIRRHPDIKHLRRASDIPVLAATQLELLEATWRLLAPGGRLLYVTCSVLREENEGVMERFAERHGQARENNVLPNNNIHALMCPRSRGFQILPGVRGMDGFYFACLEKAS